MLITLIYLSVLLPFFAGIGILHFAKRRQARFVNPLTKSMRRPPGAQLARQLAGAQIDLAYGVVELFWPVVLPWLAFVLTRSLSPDARLLFVSFGFVLALIGWLYVVRTMLRRLETVRILRLGYECELAVGQELDLLMMNGFQVFHDVLAENFNIDHVVVGPGGVFAVETKGRSKSLLNDSAKTKEFRVEYRGGQLRFPNYHDEVSVPQASRQAAWLSKWLTSATGMPVQTTPVLVLPGWFVDLKEKPPIPIIASGYINGFFTKQRQSVLNDEQIARIVHQLDARVRDLAPGELVRPVSDS